MLPLTLTRRRRKKNVRLTHAHSIFQAWEIAREWNEQKDISNFQLRLFCFKKWNKLAWTIYGMRVQLSCPIGVAWNCVPEESGSWDYAKITIYHRMVEEQSPLYEQLLMPVRWVIFRSKRPSSKTAVLVLSLACLNGMEMWSPLSPSGTMIPLSMLCPEEASLQ